MLASADDEFLARHEMTKGSMQLIDADIAHALYGDMGPGLEMSGGSAANTAAGVASLGGTPGFIGRVAADLLGEVFTHDLRAAGVQFEPMEVVEDDRGTARCLILVTPDAQRTLNTYLGVSSLIAPSDVDQAMIASAQVVFCEGYLWDLPDAKDALRLAMDLARDAGAKVAFTLSDSFCVDRHRADFLELAEHKVDILFANEAELLSLYQTDSWEARGRSRGGSLRDRLSHAERARLGRDHVRRRSRGRCAQLALAMWSTRPGPATCTRPGSCTGTRTVTGSRRRGPSRRSPRER